MDNEPVENEYVILPRGIYKRVGAFLKDVADRCNVCLYRSAEINCRNCIALWAKAVLPQYLAKVELLDNRTLSLYEVIDPSVAARQNYILRQLKAAGRPLASREIDYSPWGAVNRDDKHYVLETLLKLGVITKQNHKYQIAKENSNGNSPNRA